MKITLSRDLMMQAAKFIQNHKIVCDEVSFNAQTEVIIFVRFFGKKKGVVAWVDYANSKGRRDFWIKKEKEND